MSRPFPRSRLLTALAVLGALAALVAVIALLAGTGSGDPRRSATAINPTAPLVEPDFSLMIGRPFGQPIRSGYLGLSIEFNAVRSYTGSNPHRINPVLVQLIRNLSPDQRPDIRIGGDSTDAAWAPSPGLASPPPQVKYKLTPGWFATTGALIRALGAKLILGINLGANRAALAAAEARRAVHGFGRAIQAFEIGNEPNVYNKIAAYHTPSGTPVLTRPRSYDYLHYLREFRAIARKLPPGALAGPALAAGPKPVPGSWIGAMNGYVRGDPRVRILTIHRYPLRNCFVASDSPQYPTVGNLLSSYATSDLAAGVRRYVRLAHAGGRQLRIDELNSVACHGKRGVSDTFASGLWALDALFELAREGVDGVNLHTLPHSAYELFRFSRTGGRWHAFVLPVYYGLDLFARAAPPGSRLLKIHGHRPAGLSVWATRARDGQVRTVIDNESPTAAHNVGLRAPVGAVGPATLIRLRAASVRARTGVTLGGASFGSDTPTGILPRPQVQELHRRHGLYSLSAPPGSAALVAFSHR